MSETCDAIIVGSGICGTSIAFHLARRGMRNVLVLEQGGLCSGTTSHAPGLAGQLRADAALMRILRRSVEIYRNHGGGGYQPVGSLRLASSPARLRELQRQKTLADEALLECELIDATAALERFPHFDPAGVEGALWIPSDGSANAVAITAALRDAALASGVKFRSGSAVEEFCEGRVRCGENWLEAPVIVLATGIWSAKLGALAGVELPVVPMQHQVVWTEELEILNPAVPVANLRDPDHLVYFRQDGRRLVAGGYERDPRPFRPDWIRRSENPSVEQFDAAHFQSLLEGAQVRIPILRDESIRFSKTLNGLESFTPDGHFLLGTFPQKSGLWAACGFCAHGVSGSGGVGEFVANWIVDGRPVFEVDHMKVDRFQDRPMTFEEAAEAVSAIYSTYYDIDRSV